MALPSNPATLTQEARTIIKSEKSPDQTWVELQKWALERGTLAKNIAVMEFVTHYGAKAQAITLMPSVLENVHSNSQFPSLPLPQSHHNQTALQPEVKKITSALQLAPFSYSSKGATLLSVLPPKPEELKVNFTPLKFENLQFSLSTDSKAHHIIRELVDQVRSHASHHSGKTSTPKSVPKKSTAKKIKLLKAKVKKFTRPKKAGKKRR